MFIYTTKRNNSGKISQSSYLAESYREKGKVKHRLISNITQWPDELLSQLRLLLKGGEVITKEDLTHKQGKAIGAIYVIKSICDKLGISKVLGKDRQGMLALLQIMGRAITQGSRLYIATEWSTDQAIEEVLGINRYDENTLYNNLDWLSEHQSDIEKRLYKIRKHEQKGGTIFLYDVSSSYLEGTQNEYGAFGYNRDGKKGKMQIVYGLLCDEEGYPISIEVFKGNTNDSSTVIHQLHRLKEDYGAENVIYVGDKGMIKSTQIKDIKELQWHYLTSITKPQIKTLLVKNVIQLGMFDDELNEVEYDELRYILRRNPCRAEEIQKNRESRVACIVEKILTRNVYLKEHKKSVAEKSLKKIQNEIQKRRLTGIVGVLLNGRTIEYTLNKEEAEAHALLDGCYVIKTDVPKTTATKELLHDRYKDLALVEHSFRTMKTGFEEIRPVYVRKESRTKGHVFICMLAYMVLKYIWNECKDLGYTLKHIIETLDKIQYKEYPFGNKTMKLLPSELTTAQQNILNKLKIKLPKET